MYLKECKQLKVYSSKGLQKMITTVLVTLVKEKCKESPHIPPLIRVAMESTRKFNQTEQMEIVPVQKNVCFMALYIPPSNSKPRNV